MTSTTLERCRPPRQVDEFLAKCYAFLCSEDALDLGKVGGCSAADRPDPSAACGAVRVSARGCCLCRGASPLLPPQTLAMVDECGAAGLKGMRLLDHGAPPGSLPGPARPHTLPACLPACLPARLPAGLPAGLPALFSSRLLVPAYACARPACAAPHACIPAHMHLHAPTWERPVP